MPGPGSISLRDNKATWSLVDSQRGGHAASLSVLRYPYPTSFPVNQMLPGGSTIFRAGGGTQL